MRADGGGYEKMAGPDDRIFLALCTAAHFWWLADWWADVGMGPPVGEGRAGEAAWASGTASHQSVPGSIEFVVGEETHTHVACGGARHCA